MLRLLVLLLTIVTGATGLVYEVVWQKYLATLLGSHSEATAAVLGLFLAGLSLGYRVFGHVARRLVAGAAAAGRPPRLLLVYGAVEAGIGVYALLFPWLFQGVLALSLLLPHGAGGAGFGLDVFFAALLLLPPTLLMGGTIPLLTQALAHDLEDATRFHALVYGFNTAGACIGALAAGFVLVPWLGLRGVMLSIGLVNVAAGALLASCDRRARGAVDLRTGETATRPDDFPVYVGVAVLGGFAMMTVQTVLNRMGALAFGSSPFTFSMIAALFVLSIALGSLVVSALPRIPRGLLLADVVALCAALWWLDGFLPRGPFWVHVLRTSLTSTGFAFPAYFILAFGALLVLVGPAVVLSGATLPLIFDHLKRSTGDLGETAGLLYSWNTVGSLLGALLGGYLLLFWLDLYAVYRIALAAMLVAAALLLPRTTPAPGWAAAVTLAACLALLVGARPWDPALLHAGLFRIRTRLPVEPYTPEKVLALRGWTLLEAQDDPIASVSAQRLDSSDDDTVLAIFNNGKPDSSTGSDYATTGLVALLPALVTDRVESAFVIGWGTGVTVGELAALDSTSRVVAAEISPGVIALDPYFAEANLGAAASPKVEILRSDAYRALLRSDERFDVIASEPSNPWVAGVEMLFSREFLEAARDHLTPGGVYLQWYHQYETDEGTIDLVLRTYGEVFGSVAVWYGAAPDLLLLGFPEPGRRIDLARLEQRAARPDIAAGLARCGIPDVAALLAHELWPSGVLHAMGLTGPLHTLEHPRLTQRSVRAFFRGTSADLPFSGFLGADVRDSLTRQYLDGLSAPEREEARKSLVGEACRMRARRCAVLLAEWLAQAPDSAAAREVLRHALGERQMFDGPLSRSDLGRLVAVDREVRDGSSPIPAGNAAVTTRLYRRYHAHGVGLSPQGLLDVWRRCAPEDGAPEACREGLDEARRLLHVDGAEPAS